ncbi:MULTISPECIES: flavin reductase family protein [Paracoccus]|uniref:Flavin reductase n=1 Tax=Paracoccus onubensis TaxID=1675788 RepID=A0A418SR60_9RHOB|nr:flavin reductase family protein [Paracoccus onubensis]MDP0928341.1 flavin reductase family protein [Paracoccus onubensis]RJE83392.1 flavin reductase [Paracoccus onubensis]
MRNPLQAAHGFTPTGNPDLFRDALGRFGTGITVVTAASERGPVGMTANSFASVSLDPPLVLWSPARASRRFEAFRSAEYFAIHVLSERQVQLCRDFVISGDAFDRTDWIWNEQGVPLIEGCLSRFECRRRAVHDGGDHLIIVGEVAHVTTTEGEPLLVWRGNLGEFSRGG